MYCKVNGLSDLRFPGRIQCANLPGPFVKSYQDTKRTGSSKFLNKLYFYAPCLVIVVAIMRAYVFNFGKTTKL